MTPLMCSVHNFNPHAVSHLLAAGADVNRQSTAGNLGGGLTALMWAAYGGQGECARLLLDKGADVDLVSLRGKTARQIAASRKKMNGEGGHTVIDMLTAPKKPVKRAGPAKEAAPAKKKQKKKGGGESNCDETAAK